MFGLSIQINKISFYEAFTYREPEQSNGFPTLQLTLARFNSSEDAELVLQKSSETMSEILENNSTSIENINQVGDSSIYKLYQGILGEEYENLNAT